MRFSNFHTHTVYSDGKHTMRENVESAIEKNMSAIGFSDHSFTGCDASYCMLPGDYEKYILEARELREEYKEKIAVFVGMEKDFYTTNIPEGLDYIIASSHYIIRSGKRFPIDHTLAQQEECVADAFGGSVMDMAKFYYDSVVEHVMRVRADIIGHFDVINKFSYMPEQDEKYIELAEGAMIEALKYCKRVEVNTGAIARGWRKDPYPSIHLLKAVKAHGGEIILSSDSHNKANLDFAFAEAVDLIRTAGFDSVVTLSDSGFKTVPI